MARMKKKGLTELIVSTELLKVILLLEREPYLILFGFQFSAARLSHSDEQSKTIK